MTRSMETLLEGVIDYAGLFPPAALSMEAAVAEYLQIASGPHNWLVNRFAVSAKNLSKLQEALDKAEPGEPVPLAVIGTGAAEVGQWESAFLADREAMQAFTNSAGNLAEIQAYEVKIPEPQHASVALRTVRQVPCEDVFLEIPWAPGMDEALTAIAESEFCFAKARTGGADASALPSSEDLAGFIQQCVQLDLGFKLTAGLHHPFPHQDKATGGRMHGFINVLAATAIGYAEDLSLRELVAILDDANPSHFSLQEMSLHWRSFAADGPALEVAREFFLGFGSCSVAEPLEGLALAGWKL